MSVWNGTPAHNKKNLPSVNLKLSQLSISWSNSRIFHCPKAICSHGFAYVVFLRVCEANKVLISSHIWVTSMTFKQL